MKIDWSTGVDEVEDYDYEIYKKFESKLAHLTTAHIKDETVIPKRNTNILH